MPRSGYRPVDKEAYDLLVRISQWARLWCKHDGPLTTKLVRKYLALGAYVRRDPELERRIFQESGRLGAYKKKRQAHLRRKREGKKQLEKRQFDLNL